jgi:hypothetical protein
MVINNNPLRLMSELIKTLIKKGEKVKQGRRRNMEKYKI